MMLRQIRKRINRLYYAVGICTTDSQLCFGNNRAKEIKWIKYPNYKNDWIADPFIYEVGDKSITLFVEEYVDCQKKGRLARLVIDRFSNQIIEKDVILDLDTHLSFPIFIKDSNETYVYPENSQSGVLNIYRYEDAIKKLVDPITIIEEPLLDTSIIYLEGKYYAFGVRYQNGDPTDQTYSKELCIFSSESLLGKYEYIQSITNTHCQERGAGIIFRVGDRIIRPVQNCEGGYGLNVIFKELIFKNGKFVESVIGNLYASEDYPEGLHTYNSLDGITIVDGYKYKLGNIITYAKQGIRSYFPLCIRNILNI